MNITRSPYLGAPNILAYPDRKVREVKLDFSAADTYKAGTPVNAQGQLANDATCIGILLQDYHKSVGTGSGQVIISGHIQQDVAAEWSGVTISAEAKAALIDITFTGDGGRMGGAGGVTSWNDLTHRPFGESGFCVEYNGDYEKLTPFLKVSDITPKPEELIGAVITERDENEGINELVEVAADKLDTTVAGVCRAKGNNGAGVIVVYNAPVNYNGLEFSETGLYFSLVNPFYAIKIEKKSIAPIDSKYLPKGLQVADNSISVYSREQDVPTAAITWASGVPVFGDTLEFQYVGYSVFSDDDLHKSVVHLDVHDVIEKATINRVEKYEGFSIASGELSGGEETVSLPVAIAVNTPIALPFSNADITVTGWYADGDLSMLPVGVYLVVVPYAFSGVGITKDNDDIIDYKMLPEALRFGEAVSANVIKLDGVHNEDRVDGEANISTLSCRADDLLTVVIRDERFERVSPKREMSGIFTYCYWGNFAFHRTNSVTGVEPPFLIEIHDTVFTGLDGVVEEGGYFDFHWDAERYPDLDVANEVEIYVIHPLPPIDEKYLPESVKGGGVTRFYGNDTDFFLYSDIDSFVERRENGRVTREQLEKAIYSGPILIVVPEQGNDGNWVEETFYSPISLRLDVDDEWGDVSIMGGTYYHTAEYVDQGPV